MVAPPTAVAATGGGDDQSGLDFAASGAQRDGVRQQGLRPGQGGTGVSGGQVETGPQQPEPQLMAPAEGMFDLGKRSGLLEAKGRPDDVARQQPAGGQVE